MLDIIRITTSLCPVCFKKIKANIYEKDHNIYMLKECPEHGCFDTLVWQDTKENYLRWIHYGGKHTKASNLNNPLEAKKECPFNCGLCENHSQETCSAAIMTTNRCNMDCPICFTRTKNEKIFEPSIEEIGELSDFYLQSYKEAFPIELCGGEPTVRDDLPQIVSLLREKGFEHIQINSNGIRISKDIKYLEALKKAGASVIYLGFDGVDEKPYKIKYGKNFLNTKLRAIDNCNKVGIGVVLVPVVIPGVNDNQLGKIIEFAKKHIPVVKGVYFQPVSYFGNYPYIPENKDRITIPEVLRKLELQTNSEVKKNDFLPAGCEHPLCSFNGFFIQKKDGNLMSMTKFQYRKNNTNSSKKVRDFTKKYWNYNEQRYLTIGGMAFQDIWNIDLERLNRCIIHIIGQDKKLIPLCSKYLTNIEGERLYPGIC